MPEPSFLAELVFAWALYSVSCIMSFKTVAVMVCPDRCFLCSIFFMFRDMIKGYLYLNMCSSMYLEHSVQNQEIMST